MNTRKKFSYDHKKLHHEIHVLFQMEDTSGVEVFATLRRVAHLSELLETQADEEQEVTGARWRLMMRLLVEEQHGNQAGLTPPEIARSQHVSRNTISSLLRGLEEQGMIQRSVDPEDLRGFRIHLTPSGRDYIHQSAPRRLTRLNHLVGGLSSEEREQLVDLLEKLASSLISQVQEPHHP